MSKEHLASLSNPADPSNLFAFEKWLEGRNLTRTTGWRYRKLGLIETVNVIGRLYITRDEIEHFERRAIAGDFRRSTTTPSRHIYKTHAEEGNRERG